MTWKGLPEGFEANQKEHEGFVYRIDNISTGQYYIGKKSFWTRQKDKKTGKRVTKESNWRVYQSSNAEVQGWPESDCECVVLWLCGTKYELGYREIESLIRCAALRDPKCLNQMMGSARIGRCPKTFLLEDQLILTKTKDLHSSIQNKPLHVQGRYRDYPKLDRS